MKAAPKAAIRVIRRAAHAASIAGLGEEAGQLFGAVNCLENAIKELYRSLAVARRQNSDAALSDPGAARRRRGMNTTTTTSTTSTTGPLTSTPALATPDTLRVREALGRSLATAYGQSVIAQRVPGPAQAGSCFAVATAAEAAELLQGAAWSRLEHPAVTAPAVAFEAAIPGTWGLVPLESLAPETRVVLADPKGTGKVEAVVDLPQPARPRVQTTTIILGPGGDGAEVVWTVHPGLPIPPSQVPAASVAGRTETTAAEAYALGLRWAKTR